MNTILPIQKRRRIHAWDVGKTVKLFWIICTCMPPAVGGGGGGGGGVHS